jgi:hypothetical protein
MSTLTNPLTGESITDEDLTGLADLCSNLKALQERIAKGEELLKQLKSQEEELSTKLIPDKLDQIGLKSLSLSDGTKVEVKPFYSTKIISPDAMKWLDDNGHGGIIKTTVERVFTREQREEAIAFASSNPAFVMKEGIHFQTLTAFTKEIYLNNGSLPEDKFSVYQGSRTKLSK